MRQSAVSAAASLARRAMVQKNLSDMVAEVRSRQDRTDISGSVKQAEIERAVRQVLAELHVPMRSTVSAELNAAVLIQDARCQYTDSEAEEVASAVQDASQLCPPCSSSEVVLNVASGIVHRVIIGPPTLPTSMWLSACGWQFANAAHTEWSSTGRPCQKCFSTSVGTQLGG